MKLLLMSAVLMLVAIMVNSTGTGSHQHMTTGPGEVHRHHMPRRVIPRDPEEHHDPKRPPQVLKNPKLLSDSELIHDRSHIKEELPKYISPEALKEMTPRELDYHYFKIHDFDENWKLDGLELMKALAHVYGHDADHEQENENFKMLSDGDKELYKKFQRQKQEQDWKYYTELVDEVLEDNDRNKDGYLNYGEYASGRNRNYGQKEFLENLD